MKIQSRLVLISIVLSLYAPSFVLADELVQGVREDVIKKLEKKHFVGLSKLGIEEYKKSNPFITVLKYLNENKIDLEIYNFSDTFVGRAHTIQIRALKSDGWNVRLTLKNNNGSESYYVTNSGVVLKLVPGNPLKTKKNNAKEGKAVVNSQKSLADTVGDGFQDEAWASPTGLLPTEFPDLTYVSGPADKSSSPKSAWRKPVVLKHEDSGVLVYVNCFRRRDKPVAKDAKNPGAPFLPLREPDYQYKQFEFHEIPAATATIENRQVIAFRRGDILYKVEAIGGDAKARMKVAADTAESIWNARQAQ